MRKHFFHIIVVAYNPGIRLDETMDSLMEQGCRDFDVTIKDGGSKDGSIERLQGKYQTEISAGVMNIISGTDSGIYDAMNIAINSLENNLEEKDGYVYFLNCGDLFYDEGVLESVKQRIKKSNSPSKSIFYGDIMQRTTMQRVASSPVINDFTCYRNVPCHQACFYSLDLLMGENGAFNNEHYKVRADYEHFLRCIYQKGASASYIDMVISNYEGGGFSETKENRKLSERERAEIVKMYLPAEKLFKFDLIRIISLAPLRTKIADNPKTAGFYNAVKDKIYSLRK